MKPEMIALAKSLGLDPEVASEDEVLAAARKSHERLGSLEDDIASIKKLFKLEADADIASVEKALAEATETASQNKQKPDPEEFVPRAMYDELASRMDGIEKDHAEKTAKEVVAQAIKNGKITPAQQEWAEEYAASNPEGFEAFLEKQPKILGDRDETAAAQRFADENGGLSAADMEVAKQMGIDPETLKDKKQGAAA